MHNISKKNFSTVWHRKLDFAQDFPEKKFCTVRVLMLDKVA